uniref:Uncharacterized protein n=1 Tax=Cyprinodon variegatus TaxID=28743 RepID=A0A3Q2GBH3_CYPVA
MDSSLANQDGAADFQEMMRQQLESSMDAELEKLLLTDHPNIYFFSLLPNLNN